MGKTIEELYVGDSAQQKTQVSLDNAKGYAVITGDNNPIHFETEAAHNSRFGRPIAHGMILAGFISGVIGTMLPGAGCIYETQTIQFLKPVFYDDEITTVVTVKEIYKEKNRVLLETVCLNQNGQKVLDGEAVVLPKKN